MSPSWFEMDFYLKASPPEESHSERTKAMTNDKEMTNPLMMC